MRWTLIGLGVVVALSVAVLALGALLPKGHVASSAARYGRPAEEVWLVMAAFEEHPSWRKGLHSIERLPDRDGNPVWRETSKMGTLTYEVVEFEPPRRMVTRISDPGLPFGGSWTYEIVETEGGCEVTLTEDGEIYNPLFRFMARVVFGYHATMDDYLRALGRKLDEDVQPRRVI